MDTESASYTNILVAEGQAPNLVRADEEGSIWTSFERPKLGRLRRVLGMLREMAR